uniref:Uncharacterized protein n=1 Tax=Oryza brachyantha TaxID=4533 RepID=J3M9W0_ORYBR
MVAPGIDLPADLVWLIYDRLPCPMDRRRMRQPRPLPSILLLQDGGPSLSCVFSGCVTHRLEFRVEDARTARYFGSFDGGWVFFSIGNHRNTLHNRLADRSFKLPTLFFISKGRHVPFAILAATLSSPPVHGKSVIGAIVLSRSRLCFSAAVRQPVF